MTGEARGYLRGCRFDRGVIFFKNNKLEFIIASDRARFGI